MFFTSLILCDIGPKFIIFIVDDFGLKSKSILVSQLVYSQLAKCQICVKYNFEMNVTFCFI